MKIAHVRPIILSVDLPDGEVFAYSQAWFLRRRALVVEIETADGTVGYGEAFGPPATNAALIDEVYAPLLLGRDALDRETRWLELYTAMRDHGRKGTALEAVDFADGEPHERPAVLGRHDHLRDRIVRVGERVLGLQPDGGQVDRFDAPAPTPASRASAGSRRAGHP